MQFNFGIDAVVKETLTRRQMDSLESDKGSAPLLFLMLGLPPELSDLSAI